MSADPIRIRVSMCRLGSRHRRRRGGGKEESRPGRDGAGRRFRSAKLG